MEQKIFDNTIIAQYASTGVPLKVYVGSRYLTITDASDVENPLIGHGMLPSGEMEPFSYPSVEHLLVADNIINLETYNAAMADQFKSDEPEEAPEGDEEAPEEEGEAGEDDMPDEEVPEEEPAEEEPTTEEGFEATGINLAEISKDVLKAKMDVIKQQERELKDKESDLKKEPITDEISLESSTDGYYAQLSGPPKKADYIRFISSMADLPERLKMGLNLWYDGAIPGNRLSGFLSTLSDMAGKDPLKRGRSPRLTKKTIHGMLKAHDNAEDAYEEFAEVYIKEAALKKQPIDELTTEGQDARTMLRDLHFEIDPARQKKMKIKLGREKYGAYSDRSAIEDADYALGKYRKDIKFGDGTYFGVFLPGSYDAATSKLGDGPHKKAVKRVNWNQQKYDMWIDDVSKDGGVDNSYDMARNAKNEPGLIDWVKKNVVYDETPLERIQWDIESMAESVNESRKFTPGDKYSRDFDYEGMLSAGLKVDVNTPIELLNKLFDSFTDVNYHTEAKGLGIAIDYIEDGDKNGAIEYMDMFHKAVKGDKMIKESRGGRPYGLSKEETLEVAKRFAKALSITDGVPVTVNMTTLDEDSFDLDYDGDEFDGGSYNIYDDGAVKNMATMKTPTLGYKDDSVQSIVKYLKKHYGKLAKNEASDLPKGPSKAGVKRLIKDVEEMLDTEIDANGDPLTNETEMILQKELKRLKALLRESVNEGAMKDLHMAMDNAPNEKAFIISMFKNTKLEKSKGAIEWLHTLYKEYKSGSDTFKKELSMADESIIESLKATNNGKDITKHVNDYLAGKIDKKEFEKLTGLKKESVNEGIDGLKAGDKVQNQLMPMA